MASVKQAGFLKEEWQRQWRIARQAKDHPQAAKLRTPWCSHPSDAMVVGDPRARQVPNNVERQAAGVATWRDCPAEVLTKVGHLPTLLKQTAQTGSKSDLQSAGLASLTRSSSAGKIAKDAKVQEVPYCSQHPRSVKLRSLQSHTKSMGFVYPQKPPQSTNEQENLRASHARVRFAELDEISRPSSVA
eukprot:TRINITY_DN49362_c0_g1_i1.p1 TRINITY_DN49362_c0_g1~~TRINITY_DN49362_c0_g1_i1.p1  ORF type:complete len:188 (-),score=35.51 TRINITY_DN49362_c0_g1_i1:35-598(-)